MGMAVLGLAALLQLVAAGIALRIVGSTQRRIGWTMVAVAMALLGVRHAVVLAQGQPTGAMAAGSTLDLVYLAIAVLMLGAMLMFEPVIRRFDPDQLTLKDNEDRFRDFAEASSDWFWEMDADLKITFVSDRISEITGYPPEYHVGKFRQDMASEDVDSEKWRRHMDTLARREPFKDFHYTRRGPDGGELYIVTSGVPVFAADGTFQGYRGTGSDMTERERLRRSLVEREDLLSSIFENIPIGLMIKDKQHRVERLNRTFLDWHGVEAADIVGRRSEDVIAFQGNDADDMIAQEEQVFASGAILTRQIERRFADGVVHTIRVTKFPVFDRDGNITNSGSVIIDVTEQVTAQRENEQQSAFLDSIIENMPNMVFVKDAEDLRFTLFNRAGEELHGVDRADLIGKNDFDIVPKEQAEFFVANDRKVLASGEMLDISEEPIFSQAKGHRLLHTKKIAIKGPDGKPTYLLGISEDITDRKRIERELADSLESAMRANRAKSEFLAHMSHELRTPLNSVIGFTEVILEGVFGAPSEKHREYLHHIRTSAEHLLDVINDILDISRLEAGEIAVEETEFSVDTPLHEAIQLVGILAREKRLDLVVDLPDQPRRLRADERLVRQILVNLISNATKFTPDGGRIVVAADVEEAGGIVYRVADTGPGIPEADIPKILEPFGQSRGDASTTHEGTGLGLSISKRLAELHDADLQIDSGIDRGTTIVIRFPAARTVAADDVS